MKVLNVGAGFAISILLLCGCEPLSNAVGTISAKSSELKKAMNGDVGWLRYEATWRYSTTNAIMSVKTNAIVEPIYSGKMVEVCDGLTLEDTTIVGCVTNGFSVVTNLLVEASDMQSVINKYNESIPLFLEENEEFVADCKVCTTNITATMRLAMDVPLAKPVVLRSKRFPNILQMEIGTNSVVQRFDNDDFKSVKRFQFLHTKLFTTSVCDSEPKNTSGKSVIESLESSFWFYSFCMIKYGPFGRVETVADDHSNLQLVRNPVVKLVRNDKSQTTVAETNFVIRVEQKLER